ncbi:MAG TPA: hypothetical protein DD745_10735 [Bacteroidales bacterium]|nr:hypothetical protein [Bacteroidales bacterium]
MIRSFITILFIFFCVYPKIAIAQSGDVYNHFLDFLKLNASGNFIAAEESMLFVLNSSEKLPEEYLVAAYNNLGLIKKSSGQYQEALKYYDLAENLISNRQQNFETLADIYVNISRIYTFRKSFPTAIEYLEKAIRIFQNISNPDSNLFQKISSAYLNLGIVYYETGDYNTALEYLSKSELLKLKHNLPEIELTYLNIAKTFVQMKNSRKADEFFTKSINRFMHEHGSDYFRLAEVYFDYGRFLQSTGRNKEALIANREALAICSENYGEKHPYLSLSYCNMGDYYQKTEDYDSSLFYYQKSLTAIVSDFSNLDYNVNPRLDSVLHDVDLLEILHKKSKVLELLSQKQDDLDKKVRYLQVSLETIEPALQMIDRIRNDYMTEESRMYLAENEKKTYVFATHIAFCLYNLTHEHSYVQKMYNIAKKGKAAVLHNEIAGNELFRSVGLPDSLGLQQKKLDENIAACKKSIFREMHNFNPDTGMITIWKDALFEMNRESEKLAGQMNLNYPQYHNLLERTEPASINEIQANLDKDETLIDYFLSNQYNDGIRDLYIFLITKDRLDLRYVRLDSSFHRNAEIIRSCNSGRYAGMQNENFKSYTYALWYMYDNLIRPVEELKAGNRLIIIPDEQITWLPFDAFLKYRPEPDQTGYESLSYLIYDYTFSYGYSSSLVFSKDIRQRKYMVYAFSPDYSNQSFQGRNLNSLRGTGEETEYIYKWFRGEKYTGAEATESNFRRAIQSPAIFHLAMHSMPDTINSKYSCLVFDSQGDNVEDGNLYNYEIGMSRVISPMVVLSVCNSGSGTLYHGEGLMSLARGFTLAGASSVIKTAWEVNDETSVAVITRFYYHLSRGENKDEALRQAKLEYLTTQPPVYTNPYYWAAYEVLGDNSPVLRKNRLLFIIISAVCIVLAGGLIIYFRRRTIFSAGKR